jgi:hypothetical protein
VAQASKHRILSSCLRLAALKRFHRANADNDQVALRYYARP